MSDFSGTKAPTHALPEATLSAWLHAHVPGFAGPLQIAQFKGGQSNPSYLLSTPQARYVLRSKPAPAAQLLPSAHAIEREYQVMHALQGSGVPVPRMLGLCEDEAVLGRAFYLMEFVEGRIFWDPALPGATPGERSEIYQEMLRVQATLHRLDPASLGLQNYGRAGSYFERQIARWSKQYQASITEPIAAMERLMDWLPAHMPASAHDPSEVALVHGDYRIDNLVFHAHEPRIVAVLDWELSTLGHPLADFSYHCMVWHIRSMAAARGLAGLDLAALGIPSEAEYLTRYAQLSAGPPSRLARDVTQLQQDWNFYLAYNLFRIAAILQGIAKRVEAGTAASAQAREAASGARPLAELAWSFAERAG